MTAFQQPEREPNVSRPGTEAGAASIQSLDTSSGVIAPGRFLTALRNILGSDERERTEQGEITNRAHGIIDSILTDRAEVSDAVAGIREMAGEGAGIAGFFQSYIGRYGKEHCSYLVDAIFHSPFAWEFLEESFRLDDDMTSEVLHGLHKLNDSAMQQILESVRCHFDFAFDGIARNLIRAVEPVALMGSLIRNVRLSSEDLELAKDDYDEYRKNLHYVSKLTLLVLEDLYTAGYASLSLSELSSFYDSCDPALLKDLSDLIRDMFPGSSHDVYMRRIMGANPRLDTDRAAIAESWNNFLTDIQQGIVAPGHAAKDVALLLTSDVRIPPPTLLDICLKMADSGTFEEYGRKALTEIIVSDIVSGRKPRVLANVCRLMEIRWDRVDGQDLAGMVKSALSVSYENTDVLSKTAGQLSKVRLSLMDGRSGAIDFLDRTDRLCALDMLCSVGYENILVWASFSPDCPSLSTNTRSLVNAAYAAADADERYSYFEEPIAYLIKYDQMLADLVKDLAGFHPSEIELDQQLLRRIGIL